jgi:hypothetical protein
MRVSSVSWLPVNTPSSGRDSRKKKKKKEKMTRTHIMYLDQRPESRRDHITAHRLEFKRVLIDDDDLYNHTKPSQSTAVHEPKGQQETNRNCT